MARPTKQGMSWLPVSTELFSDTIAQGLRATFGSHALAVRMAVMLHIARSGYFVKIDQALIYAIADVVPGQNAAYIADVIQFLVNNGEYDNELYQSSSVLTSCYLQESWLRCKKGRRTASDAPYWLLQQSVVSAPETPVMDSITPITDTKTATIVYNNKDILLSPYVDNNIQKAGDDNDQFSGSKFPDLDREIAALVSDDPWLEHQEMRLHAPRQTIIDLLREFRNACIERGKTAHRSIADAKQHFVSWNNRRLYSSDSQKSTPNDKNNNRYSSRRAPIAPEFGLIRS